MVKILHLYYDLLNLYGEYGSISVLCNNLEKNNIDYQVYKFSIGDTFDFNDYDFIYCGSGTENKTEIALNDFIIRKESFLVSVNNNKHIIFTGSSIYLLGKNGIGVFDYLISKENHRICGDVICNCSDFENIVGYVNTSYKISSPNKSYINIAKGDSSLLDNKKIGFRKNNLLTINITGSLLVKNPSILKYLLIQLGTDKNNDTISHNQYESYSITLNNLKNRFN